MKYLALLIFILTLTVYTLTTSPYLQAGDSAEMATASIILGVPHQPSYPLFIFPAHLATKIPIPYLPQYLPFKLNNYKLEQNNKNQLLIYRTGLVSALFQSLANTFFFLALIELTKKLKLYHRQQSNFFKFSAIVSALALTLVYSFSTTIWLYATKPEVFSLNNLFTLALLYYALHYWVSSNRGKPTLKYILLLALSLTHHQTVIMIIPSLIMIQFLKLQEIRHSSPTQTIKRWYQYPFDRKFNKLFPYAFLLLVGLIPYFVLLWIISQHHAFVNWGEISSPVGLVRALIRIDYGSFGAYLTNLPTSTVAADQIPFFVTRLVEDLSFYLIIFFVVGLILLYKFNRKVWGVVIAFFLTSGPIFLMYANFQLDSEFSQATVVRFYMLPEVPVVIISYLAIIILIHYILKIKSQTENYELLPRVASVIVLTGVLALPIYNLINNHPVYDNLTYQYAKTTISTTEENALVLVTGDIPNMTMQYMESVENEKKQRIIFSPGQFHLNWFQQQLRQRYPGLKLPQPLPGKQFTSPSQVIDANFGKQPIYISPEFVEIDPEIQKKYVLWPKGLLFKVEKKGVDYKLEKYRAENDQIYKSLDLNEFNTLRSKSYQLETPLILYYARHFYNLGSVYNTVHLYEDALREYQRAIDIDPTMPDSYKAIGYIMWYTEDYPQKNAELAIEYFNKYLMNSRKIDEQYIAVQNGIKEIQGEIKKQQEAEQKKQLEDYQRQQKEATSSAESTASAKQSEE